MVTEVESRKPMLNRMLWGMIFLLVLAGISGYYYFAKFSLLIKISGILLITAICILLASRTTQGRTFWHFWLESLAELRRMYWPTRKETMQTTLVVLAMVLVLGILLWTADFFLIQAIGWLTGHLGAS